MPFGAMHVCVPLYGSREGWEPEREREDRQKRKEREDRHKKTKEYECSHVKKLTIEQRS